MSGLVKELNSENFDEAISNGITLVDFWAPWCGPCKMQAPVLEQLAAGIEDGVKIAKLNIDDSINIAGQLSIQAIPTLVLFKDGNEIKRFIGLQQKEILINEIANVQ
jgi:thioredoxin 1